MTKSITDIVTENITKQS